MYNPTDNYGKEVKKLYIKWKNGELSLKTYNNLINNIKTND